MCQLFKDVAILIDGPVDTDYDLWRVIQFNSIQELMTPQCGRSVAHFLVVRVDRYMCVVTCEALTPWEMNGTFPDCHSGYRCGDL